MKRLFTILFVFTDFSDGFSQTTLSVDSTIRTFTVKFNSFTYNGVCSSTVIAAEFKILKTDSEELNLPGSSIFISKDKILAGIVEMQTFFVKGYVTNKTDWVYGCFSSRWEVRRMYIEPIKFDRTFTKQ